MAFKRGGVPKTRRSKASGMTPAFRSRSEQKTAAFLDAAGISYGYESEKLEFIRPAQRCTYNPDFILTNGVYIEVKGFWPPEDRQKIMLVKRSNPDADIRMLFDTPDRPILKGSSTTYGSFCTKNNIPWAKGPEVPSDWLPTKEVPST
jgi:hypothetical protein